MFFSACRTRFSVFLSQAASFCRIQSVSGWLVTVTTLLRCFKTPKWRGWSWGMDGLKFPEVHVISDAGYRLPFVMIPGWQGWPKAEQLALGRAPQSSSKVRSAPRSTPFHTSSQQLLYQDKTSGSSASKRYQKLLIKLNATISTIVQGILCFTSRLVSEKIPRPYPKHGAPGPKQVRPIDQSLWGLDRWELRVRMASSNPGPIILCSWL